MPHATDSPAPLLSLAPAPFLGLALEGASAGLGGTQGPDLTRYLLVCGGLLVAVVLLAWGFRRMLARTLRVRAAQRSMQVLDVLPMGGKQKLAVVRCYDRTFLLGMGEREVSLVTELDPVVAPAPEPTAGTADRHAFGELVARLTRRDGALRPPRPQPSQPRPAVLEAEGILG